MLPPGNKSQTKGLLISLSFCIAFAMVGFHVPQTSSTAVEPAAIELQSLEKADKRQSKPEVQSLKTVTPLAQKESEAQQSLDHAENLLTEWKEHSLRKAIEEFDRAALIWRSTGDFKKASLATLKSGDVYFVLSQYHDALKKYQDAQVLALKKRDRLTEASALSQMARVYSYFGNNDVAQKQVKRALQLSKPGKDTTTSAAKNAYGKALIVLGEITYAKGISKKALTYLDDGLKYLEDDREGRANAHLFRAYAIAGRDRDTAEVEISQALELYKSINNKRGEALALTARGLVYSLKRDEDRAIELHSSARDIFRAIGDKHSEAIALNAIGQVYENVRKYKTALHNYEKALQLFEEIEALDASLTNCAVARMHHQNKNLDYALTYYERCLSLNNAAGKVRAVANALDGIAKVHADQGGNDLALKYSRQSKEFHKAIGDHRGQLKALNTHGEILLQAGQTQKALDEFHKALPLSEKGGDQGILISTLYNLAHANLKLGSPELAQTFIQRSIDIIEGVRANLESPEFRLSYFSGVQKHYELYSQVLMQLHRVRPGEGNDVEAFRMSEKGRARLLLELITESGADLRLGASKELRNLEHELRERYRSLAEHRMNLSLSKKDSDNLEKLDNQMTGLEVQYQEVLAQLKQKNPRPLSVLESTPLRLEEIQNELRDSNTMVLEYELGDEHSYLWAITANSFHTYELATRNEIEKTALEVYNLISARQHADVEATHFEKRRNLSQMLLGPLAEQLGNKRLVVIADGALQYIPFDALLVPVVQTAGSTGSESDSRTFLMQTNEVVSLPSVSTLIAMRRAQKHPRSTNKLVAVIADPVFSRSDDRVQSNAISSLSALAATDPNSPGTHEERAFARLAHASAEAEAISAKAPWATTLVATGFDANRETAMSSDVGQYQIVHFATHSFVDSERPEASGIVLTKVDRNGVRTNGLILLHDIYNLDLSSQLVVLSACQTALGEDVNGEGLVGLNHAFMSAGAKSVVASLWKVDDRATAVLMDKFYESMFQKGMSPAAALRAAKLEMMHDKDWSEPYFWAGFVLQGEYKNQLAVDHYSWLRSRLVLFIFLSLSLIAAAVFVFHKRKRRFS